MLVSRPKAKRAAGSEADDPFICIPSFESLGESKALLRRTLGAFRRGAWLETFASSRS